MKADLAIVAYGCVSLGSFGSPNLLLLKSSLSAASF